MIRILLLIVIGLLCGCGDNDPGSCSASSNSDRTGMPDWFEFADRDDVSKWIEVEDVRAMRSHAAYLWRGLTQRADGAGMRPPLFEQWPTKTETFATAGTSNRIGSLERPAQFSLAGQSTHDRVLSTSEGAVINAVYYNCVMAHHIRKNGYHLTSTMKKLNDSWGTTPLAERSLSEFPSKSIMIKAAYQIVHRDQATVLGYWSGPSESTTPSTPGPTTWTSRMVVQAPGARSQSNPRGLPVVSIERFYHRQLTEEEAAKLRQESNMSRARAGDYLILVAIHIATKEVPNWTWQSFWWSFQAPRGSDKEAIEPPFSNYEFDVGYSFDVPAANRHGLPRRMYNPYLEAEFGADAFSKPGQLGIESNCMSCHRAAAWPVESAKFISNGHIANGDPFFFQGNTKTDYVWGIPEMVSSGP